MVEPEERALIARLAAHESWAQTVDRAARTAPGREALADRFIREVDPDGTLDPVERAKRAESARRAFYTRLSLKSAQARRARSKARSLQSEVDGALAELGGLAI